MAQRISGSATRVRGPSRPRWRRHLGRGGRIRYDDGDFLPFVDILHFVGDLVDRESIYVAESFPADESRAKFAEHSELEPTSGLPVRVVSGG